MAATYPKTGKGRWGGGGGGALVWYSLSDGHVGFSLPGAGRSIEPPKTWGGGFGKRAQLTGTINQSL